MAQKESSHHLRLGVDFGFGFTGVALLDGARVLDRAVISHGADISQLLQSRRENRAMRRRNRSRRKRLRDFRALLKEMKLAPILPAEDEETKNRPGNQLYGIAHWRGWDYAELDELLMEESENAPPRKTQTVRDVDNSLKKQEIAPLPAARLKLGKEPNPIPRKESKSSASFIRRRTEWEKAGKLLAEGKRPPPELLRYAELETSCLGELADAVINARNAKRNAGKKSDDDERAHIAEKAQDAADKLREKLNGFEKISEWEEWINERLDAVFGIDIELPDDERKILCDEILVRLGLKDVRYGRDAHRTGKFYRPNRNRHRESALEELREEMRGILDDAGRKSEFEKWIKRAEAIINQRQRPMRVDNRRPGKCPALDEKTGVRCGCNVPRRDKPDIRRLLFEIEARQMNIVPKNKDEPRKLSENEIINLLACVDFDERKTHDKKWLAFFKCFPPPRKSDEDGESLRNKKDQLRDIVRSGKKGRTGYCRKHLAEKIRLLENDETEGSRWAALHGERILGRADATPSLLYRVDKILSVVRKMLADAKIADPKIEHIGVESARFDIASLSSLEGGRKLKKAAYSKPRGRPLKSLSDAQNGLCLFCGETMGANATVDHIFARARKGGDSWKNRAAMCAACNTQKWKFADVRLNPKAMAALDENEPGKAEFLRMRMDKSESLYSQNFSAAQATMLGGRIIRGALAEMLCGDENAAKDKKIFPIERAADLACLRKGWFPEINRKKRAHRLSESSDGGVKVNVGETKEIKIPGELQNPDEMPDFISVKNGAWILSPEAGHEGAVYLWLNHEDRRNLKILPQKSRAKPGGWTIRADEWSEINLREAKIQGRLESVDGESNREKWPFKYRRESGALKILAENPGSHELVFSGKLLRIFINLAEGDTARKYHHAIDAIIAAAPADWNRIARMAKNAKTRSRKAADVFEEEIKKARPLACDGKPYPDSSPEHSSDDWLIEQKADKSGFNRAKTKREPLGLWKDPEGKNIIVQRKPLDRLPRKNIPDITDAAEKIREALQKAWEEIDSFPPEKREEFVEKISTKSGDECISHHWFLHSGLPESHILHPKKTRSVPVKIGKPERAFIVKRKGPDGKPVLHRFDREEYWGEVAVWEINGKRDFSRRRPPFYVNADNPQEWENDKAPPENIKDKNIFYVRRGMLVRIDGEDGVWRVITLERGGATLHAKDDIAHSALRGGGKKKPEKKVTYRKLRPV